MITNLTNLNKGKIGRNDPCLCGSGKKYKKYCLLDSKNYEDQSESLHDKGPLFQKLENKVKERYKDKQVTLQTTEEAGLDKMSDIILEFASELLDSANSKQEKEGIMSMAIVAWNIAILSDATKLSPIDCIQDFLQTTGIEEEGSEEEEVTAAILLELIIKKQEMFPNISRLVVDFEVKAMRNELQLNVASSEIPMKDSDAFFSRKNNKQSKKRVA